jgi:hypothetical protein
VTKPTIKTSQTFQALHELAQSHSMYWQAGSEMDITEALCKEMKRQGIDNRALARKCNLSLKTIVKMMRGGPTKFSTFAEAAFQVGLRMEIKLVPLEEKKRKIR